MGFKRKGSPSPDKIEILKWDEKKVKDVKCSKCGEQLGQESNGIYRIGKLTMTGKVTKECPKCGTKNILWRNEQ